MRAAWWWIDRWRKSTAYTDMSLAEQGAYRNLLDELWLRGGTLPDEDRILAKASGDALEWPSVRAKVMARFRRTPEGLQNDTHNEVAGESERQAAKGRKRAAAAGRVGGKFTSRAPAELPATYQPEQPAGSQPPSPDPYPDPLLRIPSIQASASPSRPNPLVDGRRIELERELLKLVLREADLTNRDGAEVMAAVTTYDGAKRSKLNPATMSDDRLMNSVLDARARVKRLEADHGRKTAVGPREQP